MPTLPTLQAINNQPNSNLENLEFISLGGVGTVTKNLYLYSLGNEILIVDCGIGFAQPIMIGTDLVLPDITYLLKKIKEGKKIVGMLLTHGHEDHIGALPFILPKLPSFPIFATNFTTELVNLKLADFGITNKVSKVNFREKLNIGSNFKATFFHVTHSIPDTAHIFIETPVGNFYHGSDFKIDENPYLKVKTDLEGIENCAKLGVKALFLDALGAGKEKSPRSEEELLANFQKAIREAEGRVIITTFASHVARLKLIYDAAKSQNKKICFVGRSVIKAKDLAIKMGYIKMDPNDEIKLSDLNKTNSKDIVAIIAGSQGQENSAFFRFVVGEHKDIRLQDKDTIIFSADPIPGNEIYINELIEILSKKDIKVLISGGEEKFHVSGHGSDQEIIKMASILKPQFIASIGGTYFKMRQFQNLVLKNGFNRNQALFLDEGQEVFFNKMGMKLGQKFGMKRIYIDDVNLEEMETFVLMDRQKISQEGVLILIMEIDNETGKVFNKPQIIMRGIPQKDYSKIDKSLQKVIANFSSQSSISDNSLLRKILKDKIEREILRRLKRAPLIIPITISV